mmetsp:Transcript_100202/g.289327  ORF Transcript_100202/g.289327 Transcript_100202/m.289327 type:complete len:227 (+) Transcript_100202:599-1279(+)
MVADPLGWSSMKAFGFLWKAPYRSPPNAASITKYTNCSSRQVPTKPMMNGLASIDRRSRSQHNCSVISSRWARPLEMRLMACRFRSQSTAKNTVPKPPFPRMQTSSYLSACERTSDRLRLTFLALAPSCSPSHFIQVLLKLSSTLSMPLKSSRTSSASKVMQVKPWGPASTFMSLTFGPAVTMPKWWPRLKVPRSRRPSGAPASSWERTALPEKITYHMALVRTFP